MNYIKVTIILFSFLWLCGAFAVGLDKAQRFHRQGMERVRRLKREGRL
jgi:preprotein translocase subunit SecY